MTIAIAMPTSQPIAVTPPCVASDAGSRKNPEPIMLLATTNVASTGPIFFAVVMVVAGRKGKRRLGAGASGGSGLRDHVVRVVRHVDAVRLFEPLAEAGG